MADESDIADEAPDADPAPDSTPEAASGPSRRVSIAVPNPTSKLTPTKTQDAFSIEFLYYGSMLKIIAPVLSSDSDKDLVNPWIKKLFRPEYQSSKLREKRNRYLIALTINILNDEVSGVFKQKPPDGSLADLKTIKVEASPAAEWELDRMWQETLLALPDDFIVMKCVAHQEDDQCKEDHALDRVLDQEFQFLLYLTRPYAALLSPEDRTRTAAWLQTLCTIHGTGCCATMKGIRNDYLMTLLAYLHDLRLVGPFTEYPPKVLKPLAEAVAATIRPVTDPSGPEADEFLLDQPIPDDGAFCYVALTGDLVASNF